MNEQANHNHEELHRRARAQGWLKTGLLLGLGVYFSVLILTGSLNNYINPRFAWLTFVAAGVFFLLGGYNLYMLVRGQDEDGHDHGHDHTVSWGALLLLGVPLALGVPIPSQPLGADAVGGSISTTSSAGVVDATTFTIAPEYRNVLDWLRVFNAASDYTALEGQPANVIGFVYLEPDMPADEFMAARFTISCCVADASAIGLPVLWAGASGLPQGGWVQVQGVIEVAEVDGETRPVLRATSVETVAQPEQPYLFP
ncbi:MAG TPA: TIGR03943 family protein [Candidatus Limnocylindrales bacterium]|nr:TIGR03943 family protein [Candidatus Limnocylindrales bacterium]